MMQCSGQNLDKAEFMTTLALRTEVSLHNMAE